MNVRARSRLAAIGVAWLAASAAFAQQETPGARLETWPDGSPRRQWSVDDAGREHGKVEEFAADGTRTLLAFYAHGVLDGDQRQWREDGTRQRFAHYRKGVLDGRYEEFDAENRSVLQGVYKDGERNGTWTEVEGGGRRVRTASFRAGVLHGTRKIQIDGKLRSKQQWKDGLLVQLDDLKPFDRTSTALCEELQAILVAEPKALDPKDPLAARRQEALRRLQAYRHLCGLSWRDMTLVDDWNLRCDAAAEACRMLGRLDHRPPRPDGMAADRHALAFDGASHSNLAIGGSLARSVDQYMDDSDPSNIDRIGHRRWCLAPAMQRTGFGSSGNFHAMWSMDASGSAPKGLATVCYPPRGYVPVDLFSARRAFSITLLRGGAPKADGLAVRVRELDVDYVPADEPLALDHCDVAAGGFGAGATIVFRPVGIVVQPGRRYLVEVSSDGGRTDDHRYVVEFCAAVQQ